MQDALDIDVDHLVPLVDLELMQRRDRHKARRLLINTSTCLCSESKLDKRSNVFQA
jgi:hypothetical protein